MVKPWLFGGRSSARGCRMVSRCRVTGNGKGGQAMGLDNVAVQWPRTGRFYEPVSPDEFADFADFANSAPPHAGPAAALASHIAKTATVRASAYTDVVDL